ncbi:DUF3140 domain-containing protein [Actinomadura rayongensis]|uniref:DUF3140 domain-containing protein n=1 Tax=Actinomadura rayongensis TaxID=1429076 RepID=A0A6I4W2A7_9ACTN|nr:DUF3140 domain-containing protein [Actinomadura rayongensis]
MKQKIAPDVAELWDEFHGAVNMTSEELREWLLTDASGVDALPAAPGSGVPDLGRHVALILRKRKMDLTREDVDTMRRVVDRIHDYLANPPAEGASRESWRHGLMNLGHDPLKPEPHLDV